MRFFFAADPYRGPVSDHFDGEKFYSYGRRREQVLPPPGKRPSFWKWVFIRPKNKWIWRENVHVPTIAQRVSGDEVVVTFVNHSTVLIQTAGLNILTDPVWSRRASPFGFVGPVRHRPPGIAFDALPPIDVVVLSHNHYDHMDITTLRRLDNKFHPKIFTGLGNSAYLARWGVKGAHDMDWWDSISLAPGMKLVCAPAQHFSSRSLTDRNVTLWCGFIIEHPQGAIYFAGDTGYGPWVEKIKEKYKSFRLAFLPIGAYKPAWFMERVHMSPTQALEVHKELNVQTSVGIHWGTFRLADDGQDEAPDSVRALVASASEKPDFRILDNGEQM